MSIRHEDLWRALDTLAAEHGLTPSGLARAAGLDATAFNRSKRRAADGRLRWPSTESLSRVLGVTGASLESFSVLVAGGRALSHARRERDRRFRVARLRGAVLPSCFDRHGTPSGAGWEPREAPPGAGTGDYALAVETAELVPALCAGDLVLVSPDATVSPGDRVILAVEEGAVLGLLVERTGDALVVTPFGGRAPRTVPRATLGWMHRISWIGPSPG